MAVVQLGLGRMRCCSHYKGIEARRNAAADHCRKWTVSPRIEVNFKAHPAERRVVPERLETVAVLLQCSNLGGMEKVAFSLFDQLRERGYRLRIATPRCWGPGAAYVVKADSAAQAFDYRGKFGWRSYPKFRQHVRSLAKSSGCIWVIGACASCLAAARSTGRRVLLSHHYHHFENRWSRLRWTAFYLAFGPVLQAVTYPTQFTRNEALRIAPWLRSKFHVVRNGFQLHYRDEEERRTARQTARQKLGLPQDAFVVGNAGWLIKRKRFDVFLQTARHVLHKIPNAQFVICGGGPEEVALCAQAAELGIAHRVRFQGWVEELSLHYQAWDALLFNSDFDTLPCAPMEAASYGCVCVASSRYSGLSEFLKSGQTGMLFDKHDPEELADVLVKLARDPAFALHLRLGAAAKLKEEFSPDQGRQFYERYFKHD